MKLDLGRLTLESLPLHEPIVLVTGVLVAVGGAALLGLVSYFRLWGYLWREWITTIDHKRIGIMYIILGLVMLLRGFADALMMRLQQAVAFGPADGYLPAHHYDQVFTAHGVIMIFFVAMPLVTGLMNFVVPLQIGARDVSFPFLSCCRCSSANLPARAGWPIRPCPASSTAPMSASTTTSGRCRSRASARCCRAST
jgi:cytochrome o ubiquinol oxidase subunit 1